MIARLILVGMVGVLGVSLPDEAGWRARSSCTRTEAAPPVGPRAAIPFEPIAVDDNPMDRIADELNRASEVPDIPVTPVAAIRPPVMTTASDPEVDRLFAENRVWSDPATAPDFATLPDHRPRFEPIEAVADASGIADLLNRASEVVDIDPTTATIPTSGRSGFEPIAVVDGAPSVADELNRRSEGLAPLETGERPSVGDALSLTRKAALAWMNVLTKTMIAPARLR
jgi:hypothetical protein